MTFHAHPVSSRKPFNVLPVVASILVWFFAATVETGYVAVFNTGIQQIDPSLTIA